MRFYFLSGIFLLLSVLPVFSAQERFAPKSAFINSSDGALEVEYYYWEENNTMMPVIRFRIFNRSSSDRRIDITGNGGYPNTRLYRKTLIAPAGKTIRQHVYIPFYAGIHNINVTLSFSSQDIATVSHSTLANSYTKFMRMHGGHNDFMVYKIKDASVFDGVAGRELAGVLTIRVTSDMWKLMHEPRKKILLDWVSRGGFLEIEGDDELAGIIRKEYPPAMQFSESERYYGAGIIESKEVFTPENLPNLDTASLYYRFLGERSNKKPIFWDIAPLKSAYFIPVLIIIGFLIGPAIFLFCRYKKHPALALILIPITSVAACLILLLFAMFSDGVRPKVEFKSITFLDQKASRYRVHSFIGLEAPAGLSEQLVFSEDSIIFHYDGANAGDIVSEGKIDVSAMVRPRIPAFISVARDGSGRERIEVKEEDSSIHIINGLGGDLKSFVLRDKNGNYWRAQSPVKAGENTILKKMEKPPNPQEIFAGMNQVYYGDNTLFYEQSLQPSMWQAELDKNIFAEFSLKKNVWNSGCMHYVLGTY